MLLCLILSSRLKFLLFKNDESSRCHIEGASALSPSSSEWLQLAPTHICLRQDWGFFESLSSQMLSNVVFRDWKPEHTLLHQGLKRTWFFNISISQFYFSQEPVPRHWCFRNKRVRVPPKDFSRPTILSAAAFCPEAWKTAQIETRFRSGDRDVIPVLLSIFYVSFFSWICFALPLHAADSSILLHKRGLKNDLITKRRQSELILVDSDMCIFVIRVFLFQKFIAFKLKLLAQNPFFFEKGEGFEK